LVFIGKGACPGAGGIKPSFGNEIMEFILLEELLLAKLFKG
jgi:hypothetical protein